MMQQALLETGGSRAPVVIVGGGPTGLAAANLLGLAGIETLLFERNAALSTYPKAISIDDEGLRICQALGLGDVVLAEVLLNVPVCYLSGRHVLANVAPKQQRNGFPLISTFYQPALEATLREGLARFPHVHCYFQHTVEQVEQDAQEVRLTICTPAKTLVQVTTQYLLACDGGRSPIRRALGIRMAGKTAPQKWLVVDCEEDQQADVMICFFCNPARPAVSLPAPQQHRRWEFMVLPGEQEETLLAPERIRELIQLYKPKQQARIERRAIYAFHALRAERFGCERIFLLGDAAHLMPPFGGQGLNSGLRDAHNLCWKLDLVLRGLAAPRLLASYQRERVEHVDRMIGFSIFLGRVIMPSSRALALARDVILRVLNFLPPVRAMFAEGGIKPQPKYKAAWKLPSFNGLARERRALVGLMLPQPQVLSEQGQVVRLDDLLGAGFALLRLASGPVAPFEGWEGEYWARLPLKCICIVSELPEDYIPALPAAKRAVTVVVDVQGVLARLVRGRGDLYVLVRPDRYILNVFRVEETATFQQAFQRYLQTEK